MKKIIGEKVILRDIIEKDILDYFRWNTIETEWWLWDAPWEDDGNFDQIKFREKTLDKIEKLKNLHSVRTGFEICIRDSSETHIGWTNSYFIELNENQKKLTAIGIDIPEQWARSNGYGTEAWVLFINYLKKNNITDIYTQTWSGNDRAIGLIMKLGFEECRRLIGIREVRGKKYDALTFKLKN